MPERCFHPLFKSIRQEGFILPSFSNTVKEYNITITSKNGRKFYLRINEIENLGTLITLKRNIQDVTTYRNNQLLSIIKDNGCLLNDLK
ncbi:hypothetical protein [Ornithobacterium rhinotracheale]